MFFRSENWRFVKAVREWQGSHSSISVVGRYHACLCISLILFLILSYWWFFVNMILFLPAILIEASYSFIFSFSLNKLIFLQNLLSHLLWSRLLPKLKWYREDCMAHAACVRMIQVQIFLIKKKMKYIIARIWLL